MEEVLYIVGSVLDDIAFSKKHQKDLKILGKKGESE